MDMRQYVIGIVVVSNCGGDSYSGLNNSIGREKTSILNGIVVRVSNWVMVSASGWDIIDVSDGGTSVCLFTYFW